LTSAIQFLSNAKSLSNFVILVLNDLSKFLFLPPVLEFIIDKLLNHFEFLKLV